MKRAAFVGAFVGVTVGLYVLWAVLSWTDKNRADLASRVSILVHLN